MRVVNKQDSRPPSRRERLNASKASMTDAWIASAVEAGTQNKAHYPEATSQEEHNFLEVTETPGP